MTVDDITEGEKSAEIMNAEQHSRVQCSQIQLVSSTLLPLDPEKEKEGESRFTFKVKVDVQGNDATSQLKTQVVFVSSKEGEPLKGYWLQFILVGMFVGDEGISPEILGDFVRMYTISILWPYAREYASDQFQRTGEPFFALPIINPQVLTDNVIKSGLIEVEIHSVETGLNSEQ